MHGALVAILAFAATPAVSQSNPNEVPRGESAFVNQAQDNSSKVYFPDEITPESVAAARRARALEQQQIEQAQKAREEAVLAQVSRSGDGGQDMDQLSDGDASGALAQLSQAEQQVLLDAVEGTDICDRASEIPAIRELCERRIETRSAEFAGNSSASAEDQLLGGGLDADRIATLESAISRLARDASNSSDFSNQAIASVALGNQTLGDAQGTGAGNDPTQDLSPETQAFVNAIVQQLGGN